MAAKRAASDDLRWNGLLRSELAMKEMWRPAGNIVDISWPSDVMPATSAAVSAKYASLGSAQLNQYAAEMHLIAAEM